MQYSYKFAGRHFPSKRTLHWRIKGRLMLSFSRVLLLKHEDYHFTEIVLSFGSTQFQYFIMECLTMLEFQWQPGIEW